MIEKIVKTTLTATVVMCFVAFGFGRSEAQSKDKRQSDLIKTQTIFFDALKRRDYSNLEADLADNYIGTYSLGIFDKAKEITDLKAFPLTEFSIVNVKTAFPSSKVGIIAFRLHVKVTVDGKDFFEDDNINCVWVRSKGRWRLTAQTAVKVPNNS